MTINPAVPDPQGPPAAGDAATDHPLPRASIVVAALSTVVEWYDFTLYLFMATVLSRVFFGDGSQSILTTLAVFAIAYVMRPIGALVFGYFGDRFGRRPVLLGSMTVMTAAMLATALLPTQTQVGSTAGLLLLLLRCVMGFSVGGEYTGVMTYLVEGAAPGRRGLVASFAAAASEIGGLLAAGVSALTVFFVSGDALEEWAGASRSWSEPSLRPAPWPLGRSCRSRRLSSGCGNPGRYLRARSAPFCDLTGPRCIERSRSPRWPR